MAEKITGYTSEMCQQAMMDELEELFRDMKFTGQEGEKPLKIYKQFLPTQTDNDDDIDTNDAMYPCIKAQKEENKAIKNGLLAILHDRLYQACTHYIEKGYIDLPGLKNIEYLYKSYHALGGNGTGTELYTRAKALPIRDD